LLGDFASGAESPPGRYHDRRNHRHVDFPSSARNKALASAICAPHQPFTAWSRQEETNSSS
jgi:hypothetical protein